MSEIDNFILYSETAKRYTIPRLIGGVSHDTVCRFSTTCCQLVKVASILNQYQTSWQRVVLIRQQYRKHPKSGLEGQVLAGIRTKDERV